MSTRVAVAGEIKTQDTQSGVFGVQGKSKPVLQLRHTVQVLLGQIIEDGFGMDIWPRPQLS